MATQTATGKNPKPPGAPATLKQGTRPAGETYKVDPRNTQLSRGGLGPVRKDPITGADTARTGYGQNGYSSASSAGVVESSKLSDFDIDPPDHDEALGKLVKQGVGVKEEDAPQAMTGQERPISDVPFPSSFGHRSQQDPAKVFGAKLPASINKTDAPSPANATQVPGRTR
jgi:hypothetical protein